MADGYGAEDKYFEKWMGHFTIFKEDRKWKTNSQRYSVMIASVLLCTVYGKWSLTYVHAYNTHVTHSPCSLINIKNTEHVSRVLCTHS